MTTDDMFWERGNSRISTLQDMKFFQTTILGRYVSVAIHPRAEKIRGITSYASRWRHAIMWDFDLPPELIVQNLSWVQSKYNLTDLYIVKTQHGSHVYCLKTVTKRDMLRILANTPAIDWAFVSWAFKLGNARLRVEGDDLEPWGILQSPKRSDVIGSRKHKELLEKRFGFEISEELDWDCSEYKEIVIHKPKKITI